MSTDTATPETLIPPCQHDPKQGTNWVVISAPGKSSHVIPCNDLKEHECSRHCWCTPAIDEEDELVIHNAMDRRELIETGSVSKH